MSRRRWSLTGALLLPLGAVGCKSTELLMVNDLGEDAIASLQGPGTIKPDPATLPVANTGRAVFKVQTPNDDLPANYQWQAAGRIGTVVVGKDTPSRQIVNLSTGERASGTAVGMQGRHGSPSVDVRVKP